MKLERAFTAGAPNRRFIQSLLGPQQLFRSIIKRFYSAGYGRVTRVFSERVIVQKWSRRPN